jgi:hypothetical protein
MGDQPQWLVPGEGMRFWIHKPGETRIAFPGFDNYAICKETPEEIVAQLEVLEDKQEVRIDGSDSLLERFDALIEAVGFTRTSGPDPRMTAAGR